VIQLDCRSLKYSYFPLHMEDHMIILCDTGVKHNLGDSEYNKRRQQCEEGVAIISKHIEGVLCLRDLSVEVLAAYKSELTPIVYNRCKYVVEEIARVEEACLLLEQGHMKAFGQKMYDTHMGLRDLYEVSCPELDFLVDFTLSSDDVLGARMMGGGFGGCTINIVSKDYSTTFTTDISEAYKRQFHRSLKTYQTQICNGTGIVDEDLT
ncbi:MAG TPA: hypothetical protein VL947_03590, partial [Cytophagales bacterium]|nr:hypothetical protein [Cytophagales bacterium]